MDLVINKKQVIYLKIKLNKKLKIVNKKFNNMRSLTQLIMMIVRKD
jgi:hypothetical protein